MAESVGPGWPENGFQVGARVVILADNHPRWVAVFLGVVASGCTAVPLDTALHADQITNLLKDSGSSLLFCDVKHLATAQEAIGGAADQDCADQSRLSAKTDNPDPAAPALVADLDSIFAAGPSDFAPAAGRSGCGRFPALHLRHYFRSQGRDAHPRQSAGRSGIGIQLGARRSGGCRARGAAALSRALPDGESVAAAGEGRAGRLPGNAEHHRTAAGAQRAPDHDFCRGAAIFLPDSRAHLQGSSQARPSWRAGR